MSVKCLLVVGVLLVVCGVVTSHPHPLQERCPRLHNNSTAPVFLSLNTTSGYDSKNPTLSFLELGSQVQTTQPKKIPMQQKFRVTCQCTEQVRIPSNLKLPMEIPFGVCAATEVKIAVKESGTGSTVDDIRTAIGNPLKVQWAKVLYHHFSAWEGRTTAAVLGLPGGDIVEFINALDAFEEMTALALRDSDCKRMLKKFLQTTKKISFYMMTDTKAVTQLSNNVDIDNLDLRQSPDDDEKAKLLDGLVLPEHIGCRFLRSMIANSERYSVRKGLPESVIKAFFEILWDKAAPEGKKLRLVELDGESEETAVVVVKTSAECTNQGIAPLIQPKTSDIAMFVVHEAAADTFRVEMSEFMADLNEKIDAARMKDIMNANGEKYVAYGLQELANSLPVFEASII